MDRPRRVFGVSEVSSALANGSAGSKPEQLPSIPHSPECALGKFPESPVRESGPCMEFANRLT
jgi:hypothetical protein